MTASAPVRPSTVTALLILLVIVPPCRRVRMTSATMSGRPEAEPKSRQSPA
jgi:hypothetical protein